MNRKIWCICLAIMLIAAILSLTLMACSVDKEEETIKLYYGRFSYYGNKLVEYARNNITAEKAKEAVQNCKTKLTTIKDKISGTSFYINDDVNIKPAGVLSELCVNPKDAYTISADDINAVMKVYGANKITTSYYEDGSEEKKQKVDYLQGSDLKNVVLENRFIPFNQLVANFIVIYPEVIDYMEAQNAAFKESEQYNIAPFLNIFTYHTSEEGLLIVQIHDFAEIPSSVVGGVGCTYLQDIEIIYNEDSTIKKWQSSLGVYTATPTGTMLQGYILEIDFEWIVKS